ncbi:aminopeptidase N [Acidocella aquatica]|uniref:Aminopeptidase N n=1 Tax=Acidocella aquatica TaxID=1922313 RepID=A0ABQ6A8R4_9PROT|nr:aminopeptidase N [Acidocella aquatica]GLR67988.1 aminopeptidase N [Acidocella aquatica]
MADGQISPRKAINLADYTPPVFLVDEVALDFTLDPAATIVRATLNLRRQAPGPLALDGRDLELLSIKLNGEALGGNRYVLTESSLTLDDVPDVFTLETEVKIIPETNTELSGLYMSGTGFFTQCEPEGFRKITFFPDRPDVMARYKVTLRADQSKYPVLLSNGNNTASGAAGTQIWATWEDPHPKPSYLFALVAADLVAVKDSFTTASGREVALGIWVAAGDETRCGHAMYALKNAMKWDEDTFGLEYDLDIFNIAAVSDFNAGAMENKGLNIFNTAYVLASPATATDADFQGVERVIAHEYFHNWTGDRVTCRDWFQLSLKEGLTVFRDQEYMADQFSAAVKRISDVRSLRATQFRDDAGPLAHPVRPASYLEINNFYTTTIYEKGAEVVRMYRTLIGREAFRKGMDIYIAENDNSAATVEDFFAAMQAATAIDLKQIMRWYEQAGTPEVSFDESHDPAAQTYTLTLRQHTAPTPGQPVKQPFMIPVAMGLLDATGRDIHTETLILAQPEQSFTFHNISEPPTPSLFRNFSAPVKLQGQSRQRLAFLAAKDTDLFNRWDAMQQYATLVLLDAVKAHQAGQAFALDAGLLEAVTATLRDAARDPAFAAEALLLPAETLLADAMSIVDPDAIRFVREAARKALGETLREDFFAAYAQFAAVAASDVSGHAIASRALKNAALGYLSAAGDTTLAGAQFLSGENMTDTLAALVNVAELADERRDDAFASFYDQWRANALVLDKWFSVQARAGAPDTLARVQALTKHKDFDLRNPNRVRALIGAFAANPSKFHEASGAGYQLLADTIFTLDETNPQIAARLTTAMGSWRRYDTARQSLMKAQLERILAKEKLSPNTYEMASKALA